MELKYKPILACPSCAHSGDDYDVALRGVHTSCWCKKCGQWIKHLSKDNKYRTMEKIQEVRNRTNDCCAYCGEGLMGAVSIDHIFPQAKGGGHQINNLIASCKSCNSQKGKKTVEEYREYLQRLRGRKWVSFYFEEIADIDSLF